MQNQQHETTSHTPANLMATGRPLFALGRIVATPGAIDAMQAAGVQAVDYLTRHLMGEWSEMGAEDQQENRLSIAPGRRIFSRYALGDRNSMIWVITEADRSVTTILLPSEY